MATTYTQEGRRIAVSSPLGPDQLLLTGFSGEEALSRLFAYELSLLSPLTDIDPRDIVGKGVTWQVRPKDREPRYFHGVVARWHAGSMHQRDLRHYRAEVVPWLWFLTCTADCRIFQHKSTPEIVETIFREMDFTDYELNLQSPYARREYCVQYRETDFNFISHLLERDGIWYYFRHEEGKHTLVLADQKGAYEECLENEVEFSTGTERAGLLTAWEHHYEFRPGKWAGTDYNFEIPRTDLVANADTVVEMPGNSRYEIFDYPGGYTNLDAGRARAKVRIEEIEAGYDVVTGASTCMTFSPGYTFTVLKHECEAEVGQSFAVTSIKHSARDHSYFGAGQPGEDYQNTFTCIPDSVNFRPARVTRRPVVDGTQTAVVVGPKGEEIYTDQHGRVKVHFHWDREGRPRRNESTSCWVRVSQAWAGKGWGTFIVPRIGQEVVVDFLEGNPDRPLIISSVYNADQAPHYLKSGGRDPEHKNDPALTSFKSCSTPGGDGFNELRFNDGKDKEQLFMHAQKDMDVRVKNDHREHVEGSKHLIIGNPSQAAGSGSGGGSHAGNVAETNWLVAVEGFKSELVEKYTRLEAGDIWMKARGWSGTNGDMTLLVNRKKFEDVGDNSQVRVGNDYRCVVGGNRLERVHGQMYTHAIHSLHMSALEAALLHGNKHVSISSGLEGNIRIDCPKVSLGTGANYIIIDETGITIEGVKVRINSEHETPNWPRPHWLTDPEFKMEPAPEPKHSPPATADNGRAGSSSAS
jgi:type VI secretion system secreted protein VgrG